MPVTDTQAGGAGTVTGHDSVQPVTTTQISVAFGKQQRLLTPRDYKAVFDGALYKASHRSLLLLAIPNNGMPARLGLIVAKKNAKLAVQRNRLQLRERFRHQQHALHGLDIIALVKPGLWQLDNAAIVAIIEEQWRRLLKQQHRAFETASQQAAAAP